jgi:hypothetical protein
MKYDKKQFVCTFHITWCSEVSVTLISCVNNTCVFATNEHEDQRIQNHKECTRKLKHTFIFSKISLESKLNRKTQHNSILP